MADRQKLIVDVDTGHRPAVALLLAALHPDLEPVAATTDFVTFDADARRFVDLLVGTLGRA